MIDPKEMERIIREEMGTDANDSDRGVPTSSDWAGRGDTYLEILRLKREAGIYPIEVIPLPSKKTAAQALGVGTGAEESITRYQFSDGSYMDVDANTNRVISGTAINAMKPSTVTAPKAPTVREDSQGNPYQYDPNTDSWRAATGFPQVQAKAETITDADGNIWKKEPVTGNYINIGNLPLTEAEKRRRAREDAQLANLEAGNALARDRFAWEQTWEPQRQANEIAAQRERERMQNEAAMERQRLAEQTNLFSTLTQNWRESLPRRVGPNQVYRAGFGPGGPYEGFSKLTGTSYSPDEWKINRVPYDDDAIWANVRAKIGGK